MPRVQVVIVTESKPTTSVISLIPDERKKTEIVKARCGPHKGQRVRLRVVCNNEEEEEGSDVDDIIHSAEVSTDSVLRFTVANGVTIESNIIPELPDVFDGGESFSRQFGTLKQHGLALQVRFKPARHDFILNDDMNADTNKLTVGRSRTVYEIVDGAITVDKMSLAASVTTSKIAEAAKPFFVGDKFAIGGGEETPRIGKSPEIWSFQSKEVGDQDYDRSNPEQIRADARGQERCEEISKEYEEETRHWMGTKNHLRGQLMKMHDIDKKVAALEGKLKAVTRFIVDLEDLQNLIHDREQHHNNHHKEQLVVTSEMISIVEEEMQITQRVQPNSANNNTSSESFKLSDLGVYIDECENEPIQGLKKILSKTRETLALAREVQKSAIKDMHVRQRWDNYESNCETRDVLENGVRRSNMERLLGREATKADIDLSMKLPLRERAMIVGGAKSLACGSLTTSSANNLIDGDDNIRRRRPINEPPRALLN